MKHPSRGWWGLLILSLFSGGVASAQSVGPKAYIGLFQDNAVAVFDTASSKVIDKIAVPAGPHGMAITPDGKTVYVSSEKSMVVSVIDTSTDRVEQSITVGKTPHGLALTPDGATLLVAGYGSGAITFISTKDNTVLATVPVANPHTIAIAPDGKTAYIASQKPQAPALAVLDLTKRALVGTFPLGGLPRALNVSPDGKTVYFTEADSPVVHVWNIEAQHEAAGIPVQDSPHHVVFTADGGLALVVNQVPGTLSLIDPATAAAAASIKVGDLPHWIAVSADGATAWITNEKSGDVSIVDLKSKTVTAIPVGNGPRKLVVQKTNPM